LWPRAVWMSCAVLRPQCIGSSSMPGHS
jgi:hypothetical protein